MIYRCDPFDMCSRSAQFIDALCKHTPDALDEMREAGLFGGE